MSRIGDMIAGLFAQESVAAPAPRADPVFLDDYESLLDAAAVEGGSAGRAPDPYDGQGDTSSRPDGWAIENSDGSTWLMPGDNQPASQSGDSGKVIDYDQGFAEDTELVLADDEDTGSAPQDSNSSQNNGGEIDSTPPDTGDSAPPDNGSSSSSSDSSSNDSSFSDSGWSSWFSSSDSSSDAFDGLG